MTVNVQPFKDVQVLSNIYKSKQTMKIFCTHRKLAVFPLQFKGICLSISSLYNMQRMKNSLITLSDFIYSSLSLYLLCIESIKEDGGLCGRGLGFVGVAGTSV